jgi:hypothetical protein
LNGNRVLVDWNSVPDAFFYYVRYREVGTNNWRYRFAFDSQRILTGVRSDRNYEYQVITYCFADGFSPWSDVQFINAVRSARSAVSNDKLLEIESSLVAEQKEEELLLYPNPVQDVLNIQHTFNAEEVQLKIYSVEGKLIMDEAKKGFETLQLSTSRLEKGQYILLITDGENVLNKMFIKQ